MTLLEVNIFMVFVKKGAGKKEKKTVGSGRGGR